jgi:hypothetical protein
MKIFWINCRNLKDVVDLVVWSHDQSLDNSLESMPTTWPWTSGTNKWNREYLPYLLPLEFPESEFVSILWCFACMLRSSTDLYVLESSIKDLPSFRRGHSEFLFSRRSEEKNSNPSRKNLRVTIRNIYWHGERNLFIVIIFQCPAPAPAPVPAPAPAPAHRKSTLGSFRGGDGAKLEWGWLV